MRKLVVVGAALMMALGGALVSSGAASAQSLNAPGCPGSGWRSPASNQVVNATFYNNSRFVQNIYWVDFNGNLKFYQSLRPGQNYRQSSYAGHVWIAWDGRGCNFWTQLPPLDQDIVLR